MAQFRYVRTFDEPESFVGDVQQGFHTELNPLDSTHQQDEVGECVAYSQRELLGWEQKLLDLTPGRAYIPTLFVSRSARLTPILSPVHVGDSRAYLIRDDVAKCLTNDHMRAGEMVRVKMLSPGRVEILRRKTGEELKGDAVKAKRAQNRFAEELRKLGLLQ